MADELVQCDAFQLDTFQNDCLAEVLAAPPWWRQRYHWSLDPRRGKIRWWDKDGNEVTLDLKEEARRITVRPTGRKPYKPVRAIRIARG